MRTAAVKPLVSLIVSVAFGLTLSACSTDAPKTDESSEALPPTIVELDELDGATFEITAEQPLVVNAPEPADWKGESVDPSVAKFVPGELEDTAEYNPGFEAVGPGTTDASMTGPDGNTYSFTVVVP